MGFETIINKFRPVVALLVILFSLTSASFAQDKLTLAFPEFKPFFSRTADGGVEGMFFDIITEAMEKRMNIEVIWTQMPWRRCQLMVKHGQSDAMITVPTLERSFYSQTHLDPFYLKRMKIFTYKGHKRQNEINSIRSISDLKEKKFTVITYSGNGWHRDNISSLGILSYETSEVHNVWKMLAAKRGDVVIEWPIGAMAGIKKTGVKNKILETDVSLGSMPFHLLLSKKSDMFHVLYAFNRVINQMKEEGTIEEIVANYY